MRKSILLAGLIGAGLLAGISNNAFAASEVTENYVSGSNISINATNFDVCLNKTGGYTGDMIVASITGTDYSTQYGFIDTNTDSSCKTISNLPEGATLRFALPMGMSGTTYTRTVDDEEKVSISLNLNDATMNNRYIRISSSFSYRIGASIVRVNFDANGGEGTAPTMNDFAINTDATLPSNTFTRTGYVFDGWNTKADGSGTSYSDEATVNLANGGEVTLYAQWKIMATATMDTGSNVNIKLKKLAGTNATSTLIADSKIRAIKMTRILPADFAPSADNTISVSNSELPIYAWYDNRTMYVYTEAYEIALNTNCGDMFYRMESLNDISGLANWDTSEVTDMNEMFYKNSSLTDLMPLANWVTSSVTNMASMFRDNSSLTDLAPLANWDTSCVTSMSGIFWDNSSLTDLAPLANWVTSSVTSMSYMFQGDSLLTDLTPLANWDTSKVKYMGCMFSNNSSLMDLAPLANWVTSSVVDMNYMFYGNRSLTDLAPLANWDTSKVMDMSDMFAYNSSLTSLAPLANWVTSSVTDMAGMFSGDSLLTDLTPLANWDTSKVMHMNSMFSYNSSLTSLAPLANWVTSSARNMSYMFSYNSSLTSLAGLENWDTSSVTNMREMFYDDRSLMSLSDLANWDTSSVTNMKNMFYNVPSSVARPSWYN